MRLNGRVASTRASTPERATLAIHIPITMVGGRALISSLKRDIRQ